MAERRCAINDVGEGGCGEVVGWAILRQHFHIPLEYDPRTPDLDQVQISVQNPLSPRAYDLVAVLLSPHEYRPTIHQISTTRKWLPKEHTNWLNTTGSSRGRALRLSTPDHADRTGIPPVENRIPDSNRNPDPQFVRGHRHPGRCETSLAPRIIV